MNGVKYYNVTSISNTVELGKRGGVLKFNKSLNQFELIDDTKQASATVKIAPAVEVYHAVTLQQLNDAISASGGSYGASSYTHITASQALVQNNKYYVTTDTATHTLPNASNVAIGDCIIVRATMGVDVTIQVYDSGTDTIITEAGSSTTIVIDTMSELSFIYASNNVWEIV